MVHPCLFLAILMIMTPAFNPARRLFFTLFLPYGSLTARLGGFVFWFGHVYVYRTNGPCRLFNHVSDDITSEFLSTSSSTHILGHYYDAMNLFKFVSVCLQTL